MATTFKRCTAASRVAVVMAQTLTACARAAWALMVCAVLACSPLGRADSPMAPQPGAAAAAASQHVLNSIGDPAMGPLMDAWMDRLQQSNPGIRRGARWRHASDAEAIGALMFELADVAPLAREFTAAETAPYVHQFAGDMMKAPLLIRVAGTPQRPLYIALNRRPDSPLPPAPRTFIAFALSAQGQGIAARVGYAALDTEALARERAKLDGYVAELDPELPRYRPVAGLRGAIRSVGSDGMKSLMERWMRDFQRVQPDIRRGERWEHLGTLNGFHALLQNETDLAPMGRELWPDELARFKATHGGRAPVEIRVARGGFNTPQRTTAQAIFVNEANPVRGLSLPQLADILSDPPRVTRWGQLGLDGEWADRAIAVYMPPKAAPNAMSMQISLLLGGAWNRAAREGSVQSTAEAIARDPSAIGFGGFEDGGPGLRAVPLSARDAVPLSGRDAAPLSGRRAEAFVAGTPETASSGRYPLTRYLYIRFDRISLNEPVAAFLRYVLSAAGQEPVRYSGYFPLSSAEVSQDLARLDALLHE